MLNQNRAEKAPDGRKSRIGERLWTNIWFEAAVAVIISAVFAAFIWKTCPSLNIWWPRPAALIFAGLAALAMLLLVFERRYDALELLAAAACICCAMYARVALLPFESGDYKVYLSEWVKTLGEMSWKEALSTPVGNYNLPYIYFLTILSRFNVERLIHIKAFSCLFDVILAYAVMKLVRQGVNDRRLELGAFFIVLLSPTVMIDSALWAQCDSIFVAFCVISALAAVQGRGRLCAISWTVAFCFKLQAVFMLPALAVALFMGKVRPKHLLWIPAVYFISIFPALISGRSFMDCVSIYTNQMGYYSGLSFNAPNVWDLFAQSSITEFETMALYIALAVLIIFTGYCIGFRKEMTDNQLVTLFFLSTFIAPFILPKMHERYFYMAEIFAIVYFMYDRRKWYVPVTITLASLTSYLRYFAIYSMTSQEDYLAKTNGLSITWFAVAYLVILAVECRGFFKELWSKTPDTYI